MPSAGTIHFFKKKQGSFQIPAFKKFMIINYNASRPEYFITGMPVKILATLYYLFFLSDDLQP